MSLNIHTQLQHYAELKYFIFFVFIVLYFQKESVVLASFPATGAMRYLSQYGYLPPLNPTNGGLVSEQTMQRAIAEFQSFAGLNITGSRWRVKKLTYKISKYPRVLEKGAVDKEIAKAFSVWSDYTNLQFTPKKSGQVHIEIRFERGEHGDGDPFDGPGGTLAHAYFPVYGGDAHFDDTEQWTINSFRGTNLFQVAAHEFGHSLGLSHSDVKSALMAPFYRGYDPDFLLESDDIQGIQALYGSKNEDGGESNIHQRTTHLPPSSEEDSQLCSNPKIDTIFNSAEGDTFVFRGDLYWKLTTDGVESGYPRLISTSWKNLPGNIDAAFTYKNGKTYFFKGSKYWRYIGRKMDGDYPKDISEGFTGIPDNLDAVTVWTGNGKIYFYKGTKFWRFDPLQKPPVKSTYPKLISNWEGIPDNVDASITYHGYTYFFKDNAYFRFNDRSFSVDVASPSFPRSIAYWWFGCRSTSKGTLENVQWLLKNSQNNSILYSKNSKEISSGMFKINKSCAHDNHDDTALDTLT
ncbi:matrix metalloproteinase 1 isoform X1 [Nasonia vitripennis]|uniref:Peptidase metallopeptidase domain-containing protein n=2 Tax=Nasonia vitripennis TaxID=7425 RepID=A0A7M7QDP6_NASVI|nr:matrix metalloproteinase 1 isoform X1 [Nasonia vitripennis]